MLDRPRKATLGWAAGCFAAFLLLAFVRDLAGLSGVGRDLASWAHESSWLIDVLRVIETGSATLPVLGYAIVLGVVLFVRRHRRAGVYAAGVVALAALASPVSKALVDRERPTWQDPVGVLTNGSYPSGHATVIAALGGVLIVLAGMYLRRSSLRRAALAGVVVLAVVVGLDRVLLGRHFPLDVVGGYLLGATVVLVGLVLYSPLPGSHAAKAVPLPQVFGSDRRLAVVLNPIKVEDVGQFRAVVEAMAAEAGWNPPTWHYTTIEDSGTGQAEQASIDGADLVLVCGGDGTVREVCAELAGTGIPVGVIPAGTGNLLARNLDVPLYLRAAIDVALTGQDRAIDLVEVSGDGLDDGHFIVMAGMGFDAAIMEGVNEDIKKKVGWLAYVLSGLKALMFPTMKLEVSIDDGEFTKHRARTVVVGNVGSLQGGMVLLPDARLDDGTLDVVLLYPQRFLSWFPLVFRVLSRREQRAGESVVRFTGKKIVIRASAEVPRQIDGDAVGPGHELRMECLQGRLLVRVPR